MKYGYITMTNHYTDVARKIALHFNDRQLTGSFCCSSDGLYCSDAGGKAAIYFAEGWTAVFPAWEMMKQESRLPGMFKAFSSDENLCLATTSAGSALLSNGKRKNLIRLDAHGFTAFINPQFTRLFPKATLYYISAPNKPVVAGLWENDIFKPFAIICPIVGTSVWRAK